MKACMSRVYVMCKYGGYCDVLKKEVFCSREVEKGSELFIIGFF